MLAKNELVYRKLFEGEGKGVLGFEKEKTRSWSGSGELLLISWI